MKIGERLLSRLGRMRYLAAVGAVILAFVLREVLSYLAGPNFSEYVVFYPTAMIVALLAGLGPGLLAVLSTAFILTLLRFAPVRVLPYSPQMANLVSFTAFIVVCAFLTVVAELYRRSRVKAEAYDREQALRERQEAIRQQAELLRLSFDAISVWNLDGGIESWNRGAEELYGFTEEQARGKNIRELLHTRHALPRPEFEQVLRAQGQWDGELWHRTRAGAEVVVSSRLHLGQGTDGELRVLEIDRDITDQKRFQQELQRAHDQLEEKVQQRTADLQKANRSLLMISACDQALVQMSDEQELIAVICHIVQEDGGYALVWAGLTDADGRGELRCVASAGDRSGYLDTLKQSDSLGSLADGPAGDAVRAGSPAIVDDITQVAGAPRWKAGALERGFRGVAAFPLLSSAGTAFGVLVVYSEQAAFAERPRITLLEELVNDLAFGVMALRARQERDQAQQALESQARQLRILAGEVVMSEQRERNRIAQLLHDHLQQHLAAALYGLNELKRESAAAERMAAVVRLDGILRESIAMSRSLTSELGHPAMMEPDLSVGLEWLASWMKEKHGLDVIIHTSVPVILNAEDVRITLLQAVRELLFNVAKHAKTKNAVITLTRSSDDRILVTVSDDGVGFDSSRIAPLRESGAGGMGLFSLRERLTLSGGGIEVSSSLGKGSRVTVWVPASPHVATTPPVPMTMVPPKVRGDVSLGRAGGNRIRILLADDHAIVRDGLVFQLAQQADMEVVGVASNGESAIEMADALRPDVVTMDVGMPGIGGIVAARQIHAKYPEITVIGVSMYDDAAHEAAMRDAGAVALVSKSASIEILLSAIRAAVS